MNIDLTSTQTLIMLLQGLLIVAIAVVLAKTKKRSPLFWGIVSLFLGVYALFVLVLLPLSKDAPMETEEEKGKAPVIPIEKESSKPKESAVLTEKELPPIFSPGQLATADWFFVNEKKEREGPFRLSQLREFVDQGKVTEHSWVWCELFSSWRKIESDDLLRREILAPKVAEVKEIKA